MSTTMSCKNCGAEMHKRGVCDNCDWRIGWLPFAQSSDGTTTFVGEPRHKFMTVAVLLATFIGLGCTIGGIGTGDASLIFFGLFMAVTGIFAWRKTHLGKVWRGLPGEDKAVALPGVVVGAMWAILLIPLTILVIAALNLARFDR